MSSTQETIGDNPTIALQSNWLTVNHGTLWADVLRSPRAEKISVSPEALETVLLLGRRTILQGTEEFYHEQVAKNPGFTIARPAIWTAQLGTTVQTEGRDSQVLTEKGYANGGIIQASDEIQPAFRAHWDAIVSAGFVPEVRQTTTRAHGGSWLSLRKPTLGEVLHNWLGWKENVPEDIVEMISDEDKAIERCKLRLFRMLGEQAVDRSPDSIRSREQVGLIIAMAAVKSALGNKEGYEEEIDDALTYADNAPGISISTVRAIENSTFEIDQTGNQ